MQREWIGKERGLGHGNAKGMDRESRWNANRNGNGIGGKPEIIYHHFAHVLFMQTFLFFSEKLLEKKEKKENFF